LAQVFGSWTDADRGSPCLPVSASAMQNMASVLLLLVLAAQPVHAGRASPIGKVLQMLSELQAKIVADGEEAHKVYAQLEELCGDRSKELAFQIKTGKSQAAELQASILKQESLLSSHNAKIEELTTSIAGDEADLKSASEIRAKEAADFATEEKELSEVIDMLERSINVLEREMRKGESMLQTKTANTIAEALKYLVQASAISSKDGEKLAALVQSSQLSEDGDEDLALGAPAAAAYEGHSGNIIDTLESLLEKAQTNLAESRKKESSALHNFEMLKQSLEDDIKFATKDMNEAKMGLAESNEAKATGEGDLETTSKALKVDSEALDDLHQDCLMRSQDYEATTNSRAEELKALAEAKKVISETTSGAEKAAYGLSQASLLQTARLELSSGADLAKFEAVRFVRDLARKQNSAALAQLASRMAAAMRVDSDNEQDPFAKVKSLVSDMIARLEEDAAADASHKAYCDKELSEASTKKTDKSTKVEKLSTKIDQMTSRAAQLREEIGALQKSLSQLTSAKAEMVQLRQVEHTDYVKNKADLQEGLQGIKMAMKILREYYAEDAAHGSEKGAGAGIIALLEVVEGDMSKSLVGIEGSEETAESSFKTESKENEFEQATLSHEAELKTKEAVRMDKSAAEAKADRGGLAAELDAVTESITSLNKQCAVGPETYDGRKSRREAEIAGLREALQILEGEAVLLQQGGRGLRGRRPRRAAA